MNNTVNVMRLENAAQQQLVENFAMAIADVIAKGIRKSSTGEEVEGNITSALQNPTEEMQKSILSLVTEDGLSLADEAVMRAFKDALWANSREIVHETVDLLWRQGLAEESGAE